MKTAQHWTDQQLLAKILAHNQTVLNLIWSKDGSIRTNLDEMYQSIEQITNLSYKEAQELKRCIDHTEQLYSEMMGYLLSVRTVFYQKVLPSRRAINRGRGEIASARVHTSGLLVYDGTRTEQKPVK